MASEAKRESTFDESFDSKGGTLERADQPKKTDGNASFLRAARAGNLEKVLDYLKGSIDINTSNANGLNALHLASKEGHVNVVTELLKRGANVEAATKKGNTALHIASLAGQEEIVKILVQNHAKVNVQATNGGFTPLYMAAQENHKEVVKYLLANGASQTLATDDGFTPLAVALQQGHDKVVAVLLENDTRGKVKLPALHIAAKKDDVKAASLLLQSDHGVDSTSKSGFTPLHIAAHYGNINVGALLIEKGAQVNFKARNNITPLHVASKWGRNNMVTLLLDSNALIDSKTRDGLTPLHCGARSGHDQVVDLLLERGAPVAEKTKNGLGPLHMAAQGDHVDCARLLLYHKAPLDDVTVDYLTPLHVAAHCGNVRTAKLLLDKKCEVDARALNGFTPLHIACKKNRIKVVELLLKYGASITATTESGLTPLHVASFMGHMNIVIYLIQHGANPDTPTVRGETALHLAARANQTDIIRILLRNGAQVDARAREQQTPLHIASRLGNVDNVVLLLQHGASPDATTKDLYTPLHIAAKEGHEEVTSVLLEHGSNQALTTKKGFTPLHIAAKYGNIKVARLLLQKDADPNVQGKNGLTPLHVATHYNNVNVALLLLESKASPHAAAKNGYTPLHIAAKKNQMDIATTLIEYGAKPNAESKNGFTPLHLAAQEGHTDMVSLLLEHKADVNCKAKNGLTPMHLAAQEDKVPVAEVLVKYEAEIDPHTKAGYTPLHTACHFGQINMIRFLLERGASVNATTKLGYTPLHQAAQQGHVLVINLLLKYKADPNAMTTTGQTPLSIAQKLGYISVVEILKTITEAQATQDSEKYKVVSPETMQEAAMTDSEDEAGEDTLLGDQSYQYLSTDDMKMLHDDSISPTREDRDFSYFERYSVATAYSGRFSTRSSVGPGGDRSSTLDGRGYSEDPGLDALKSPTTESAAPPRYTEADLMTAYNAQRGVSGREDDTDYPAVFDRMESRQEERLHASVAPREYHAGRAISEVSRDNTMYGSSYSGVSFASSFDPDNVAVDRHPQYSGFLVSFMVDARGGAMRGCRHSGVRIIVPPGKACMPTRVTCKLVKKEKLMSPPPVMESEALASRILEMGPVGAKFLGPVIIEVPHFASLRDQEREIVILRSDDGQTWKEHPVEATEEAIHAALNGSFEGEDLESAEELYQKRITRILTTDFPNYFAIVSRIRKESKVIGPEGAVISSSVSPHVQVVFPEGALTKKIVVGLQAQPVQPELVSKLLGNRVAVSPIVTVEPRRRRFHKPITVTIPVPKAAQKGMLNQYGAGGADTPTLRLLCSITGGVSPAQWEDITGSTPLTFVNDCLTFTTGVTARFWLMDCQNYSEAVKMATELYREVIAVPFMSKFVVFAKRRDNMEARLRVFCMTDDKMDKTLESQEHFTEVARSRDVEVLEGKPQYVEMGGNIVPVTKSGDQLYINFHAFRENRLPFVVRIRDPNQEPIGRVAFMREPKVARGDVPQTPMCNLNITLPPLIKAEPVMLDADDLEQKYKAMKGGVVQEEISRAELRINDIADCLQGDWVLLAPQLGLTDEEVARLAGEYDSEAERAIMTIHLWAQKAGEQASGNELERALKKIGREDVIRKCIYNVQEVTDEMEKAAAKAQLDQSGFDDLRHELGASRDSSMARGLSLDVSYDEQDLVKESESAQEESDGEPEQPKRVDSAPDDAMSPVAESPVAADEASPRQPAVAVEELITSMEGSVVHGMDDRRSLSSEEDDDGEIVEQDDSHTDRHLPIKTKTPPPSPTEAEPGAEGTDTEVSEDQLRARLGSGDEEVVIPQTAEVDQAQPQAAEDQTDSMSGGVRVYTDTVEGEPQVETDVQEFEETLPDGTVVKRKVIKTKQRQTIVKRVVMEGPETDLPSSEEYAQAMIANSPTTYTDASDAEPTTSHDVEEFEETLEDGTVVKRKVVTTTEQQLRTERTVVEGAAEVPGFSDDDLFPGGTEEEAARHAIFEGEIDEPEIEADEVEGARRAPPPPAAVERDDSLEEVAGKVTQQQDQEQEQERREPVAEEDIQEEIRTPAESRPPPAAIVGDAEIQNGYTPYQQVPELEIPDDSMHLEDGDGGIAVSTTPSITITEDLSSPVDEDDYVRYFGLEQHAEVDQDKQPQQAAAAAPAPPILIMQEDEEQEEQGEVVQEDGLPGSGQSALCPQIVFQEASPMVQSPTSEGEEHDFSDQQADMEQVRGRLEYDSDREARTEYGGPQEAPVDFPAEHPDLTGTLSTDVQIDKHDLYDDQDEEEDEDDSEARPLSPTDFTLQDSETSAGRIEADIAHQIFLEQSAAATSVTTSERPPSPSDYTLVAEEQTTPSSHHIPDDVYGVPEPVQPVSPLTDELDDVRPGKHDPSAAADPFYFPQHGDGVRPSSDQDDSEEEEDGDGGGGDDLMPAVVATSMPHSATDSTTHDEVVDLTTPQQLPTTTTLSHDAEEHISDVYEEKHDVYSEEREDSYQQRITDDDAQFKGTTHIEDQKLEPEQQLQQKTVSFEPEPHKTDFFEYQQGPDDSEADQYEEEAADRFPVEQQVESDDDEVGMALGPRTSSYEDIYVGVKGPLEDEESTLQQPVGASALDIGDRFDTRHVDSEFRTTKASSFENLYEAGGSDEEEPGSFKEAGDVEEKDIDEASRSSTDDERPEKGEGEDEKEQSMLTSTTRPTPNKYPSPIDVTLESGLDLVGQDSLDEGLGHPQLERTHSYNIAAVAGTVAQSSGSTERPRHYSSPDAAPEFPDGDELLGDEGDLDEAAGGEMQTTRLVLKKQVHKKTVIRDGKEETIVTEDTHVEQDNEGPEELQESVQGIIDEFMEGGDPAAGGAHQ